MTDPIVHRVVAEAELSPAPIREAWIREGTPTARCEGLGSSSDKLTWTDVWDCTAGTFEWHYSVDETVHIVDGEAFVTDLTGFVWHLRAGDVVSFSKGTVVQWRVPEYVRKIAFCRRDIPRWASTYVRGSGLIRRQVRRTVGRLRHAGATVAPVISLLPGELLLL